MKSINLETALKMVRKNSNYEVRYGDGFTNVIRCTKKKMESLQLENRLLMNWKNTLFGCRLNRVSVETNSKNIGDIKAFYETQTTNMK